MDIQTQAFEHLQRREKEAWEAALVTDERARQAREAVREVTAAYRDLVSRVKEPGLLLLIHVAFGVPLSRAAVALGEPTP